MSHATHVGFNCPPACNESGAPPCAYRAFRAPVSSAHGVVHSPSEVAYAATSCNRIMALAPLGLVSVGGTACRKLWVLGVGQRRTKSVNVVPL
jgi:hypothetical protein